MLLYTTLVYAWAYGLGPLGRDYAALAGGGEGLSPALRALWRWEAAAFGDAAGAYIAFNALLLYASMLLLFQLTNRAVRGPWWFGTLAAVLYMANPVHSEAVLNLSGAVDLVPCLLALAALVAYAVHGHAPSAATAASAIVLFALAVLVAPDNIALVLVVALWEVLRVDPERRSARRLLPFAALTVVALYVHRHALGAAEYSAAQMWAPLYFILYPIGYLPETVQRFHAYPALGWLSGATVLVIVALIYLKAQRPAILFGLLAVFALRLYPGNRPVDPVHLVGGGQLLLANALLNIALMGLFYRMMDHPRWRIPIISGTTLLVAVFFVLMIRAELAWKEASREVRAFQAQAQQATEPVGVLPDYRYYQTAPVCLSESIAYDTPFSRRVPHRSLLPLHKLRKGFDLRIERWTPHEGVVSLDRAALQAAAPWPYELAQPAGTLQTNAATVTVLPASPADPARATLRITPRTGTLPPVALPGD